MQEKDAVTMEYFESPARFADLVNGYIHHGEQVVKAEEVVEAVVDDVKEAVEGFFQKDEEEAPSDDAE